MIALVANLAWLSFKATDLLKAFAKLNVSYLYKMMGLMVAEEAIPQRFFEISFLDKLKILFVYHGADILLIVLTMIGIFIVIKKLHLRFQRGLVFLSLYVILLWAILLIQIVSRFGELGYGRIIQLVLVVSPIFSAVVIFHFERMRAKKVVKLLIPLMMILATIELYHCQPLIPSIKVSLEGSPSIEPIVYVNVVNSAYQRRMIMHAERYISTGRIACDRVTLNQIYGLTDYSFSRTNLAWYYPYSNLLDENTTQEMYDYFLIHLPGKSGVFGEPAEIRSRTLILDGLYGSSIVYTNGESYICSKPFGINHISD